MRSVGALLLVLVPALAHAQAQLAGPGGTCAAHADCKEGLRCQNNKCVDEDAFVEARKVGHATLDESFGFFGVSLGGALPAAWAGSVGVGALLGLRLGWQSKDRVQVQVELTPVGVLSGGPPTAGYTSLEGTIGYGIAISDMVSWIVRVGGGGGLLWGNFAGYDLSAGFGEVRLDVVGVGVRTSKHLYVEFNVPSCRLLLFPNNQSTNVGFLWVTSVIVNYTF